MTAITALISKNWIATASDSLLTEFNPVTNEISSIEFRRSKIVPIRRFKASIAYWGLAKVSTWRTYDFLKTMAREADNYDTLESFANEICLKLKEKLSRFHFRNPIHQGIGIHLTGFEDDGDRLVPELFLISNYLNSNYNDLRELGVSRNLYETLPDSYRNNEETLREKRNKIVEFLDQEKYFIFNNGDPLLFNPTARSLHNIFHSAIERNVIRVVPEFRNYMKLASKPIELIKMFQSDFFNKNKIRIGGKIHRLLITQTGHFISDTGDDDL